MQAPYFLHVCMHLKSYSIIISSNGIYFSSGDAQEPVDSPSLIVGGFR